MQHSKFCNNDHILVLCQPSIDDASCSHVLCGTHSLSSFFDPSPLSSVKSRGNEWSTFFLPTQLRLLPSCGSNATDIMSLPDTLPPSCSDLDLYHCFEHHPDTQIDIGACQLSLLAI